MDQEYHSSRGWYVGSKDGEIETIGRKDDLAVINPALSASEIALLKGLLKQLQGAGSGAAPVQLTGSTVEDSQAVPMTQAQKDIVARAIDNILNTIGAENCALFLPINEVSGDTVYDLLNKIPFSVNGSVTLGQSSPFGKCALFSGGYLQQKSVTENNNGTAEIKLLAGQKLATRMKAISTNIGFARLKLKRIGTLSSATIKVSLYTNSSDQPGSVATFDIPAQEAVSSVLACSDIGTTAQNRGFVFPTIPKPMQNTKYWLVLEYVDSTDVDENNCIVWLYETAPGTYGEARAVHDGSGWTVTSNENHVFGIWDNKLLLTDDFTVLALASNTNTSSGNRYVVGVSGMLEDIAAGIYHTSTGAVVASVYENSLRSASAAMFPTGFHVYGLTFSKTRADNKIKVWFNNRASAHNVGTADTSMVALAQPFCVGINPLRTGLTYGAWAGYIGCVIVATVELSDAQIGDICHSLFALRKYGVAI